jgi:hypothetical protein
MMEVVAVNVGGWKRVKRVELEHNGISDEEFVEAQKQARRASVFGEKLWLDRRTVKVKKGLVEQIRQARRELTLLSPSGSELPSPLPSPKGRGSEGKEGVR